MRGEADDADHHHPGPQRRRRPHPAGAGDRQPERQLHRVHPQQDRQRPVGRDEILGVGVGQRVAEGRGERGERRGVDHRRTGAQDDQHAGEAEHHRADARRVEALAEEQHREQRGPDRRGELDREHLGDRDVGDGVEPAELRGEVDAVAQQVLPRLGGARQAPALRRQNRREDDQADDVAERDRLRGAHLAGELATGDPHQQERDDGGEHPRRRARHGFDWGLHGERASLAANGARQPGAFLA